jgi:hypothetical protein
MFSLSEHYLPAISSQVESRSLVCLPLLRICSAHPDGTACAGSLAGGELVTTGGHIGPARHRTGGHVCPARHHIGVYGIVCLGQRAPMY